MSFVTTSLLLASVTATQCPKKKPTYFRQYETWSTCREELVGTLCSWGGLTLVCSGGDSMSFPKWNEVTFGAAAMADSDDMDFDLEDEEFGESYPVFLSGTPGRVFSQFEDDSSSDALMEIAGQAGEAAPWNVPISELNLSKFSRDEQAALAKVESVAVARVKSMRFVMSSTPLNADQVATILTPVGTEAADAVDLCNYSFTRNDRWGGGCAGSCYFGRVACRVAVAAAFAGLGSVEAGVTAVLIETMVCQSLDRLCEDHCSGSIRQKMRVGYEFALCHEGVSADECKNGQNDWVQVTRVIPRWMRSTHHELRHSSTQSSTPGRVHELRLGFDYTDSDGSQMRKAGRDWVCRADSSRTGRRRAVPAGLEMLAEPQE